jgi:hypothetical protein
MTLNEIQVLPPGISNAGHEFSYATWNAGTRLTLANVPWNSDYRDIVHFDNQAGLDNYLDTAAGPILTTGNMTYRPMGFPVRLDIPFERANRFNYLRATNPAQPLTSPGGDTGRTYYYFVAGVNYVAPNTTELILQLDVWQSFIYGGVRFGNCYIEQGHVGVANENGFANFGRDYLTQPEGLDVGGEYMITDQWTRSIGSARTSQSQFGYSVMVTTTVSLESDPGDVNGPKLTTAKGSSLENLPNGAETWIFGGPESLKAFLAAMSDKPWVTQGIVAIQAIPHISVYGLADGLVPVTIAGVTVYKAPDGKRLNNVLTPLKTAWRSQVTLPDRYRNLLKFKTYPYMVLEMTSYTGTPLLLKPESWMDQDANVLEIPHIAPPGARVMFTPYKYNAAPGTQATTDTYGVVNDGGEFLDMATGITNFPQFSTVNNSYAGYMASNMNGIAYQHSSADWAQTRALAGNENSARQATSGIAQSQSTTAQGISAATQATNLANEAQGAHVMLNGMGSMVTGAARGAMAGPAGAAGGALMGAAGGVMNGLNAAVDMNQRNQQLGISNTLAAGVNQAQTDTAGFIRDSNKQYGDWAANGDYQNSIAGINAKVQDAKMIQPTTSGQVGGDAFLLTAYKWGYDVKVKMLQPAVMASIGEYWLRYGYKVNRFGRLPESFMVCEKFTYWKLKETYITASNCPETFKQTLRGIFEKGVTVWKNPSDIGNIDIADNAPLAGVTL